MEIIKAETAGFCFGVDRAVKMTYDLLASGHKVATLGPLIHNPQCVADLAARGAVTVDSVEEIPAGYEVVIRSHGVPQAVYDALAARGLVLHDATCPFVAKIHRIAERAGQEGKVLFVAGDAAHPEVQGIVGHTRGSVCVFADLQELQAAPIDKIGEKGVIVVAQTTFEVKKWLQCSEFIEKVYTNAEIFDTICNATWARQRQAEELSQKCDLMVVIGGHHSSNTQKLVSVAARHTKAVSVEIAAELCPAWFSGVRTVGVTAGASTPSSIIEEVLSRMSDEIREEELSFEEMINASMKPIFAGQTVKGIVTAISPSEIQVDIGVKQTGFVKLEELTNDPTAKAEDVVKKGDELDLMVTSVKDQDGIVYLSKRRLDENKGKEEVAAAVDSGEVMEGYVTEFNSGGVVALVNNVRVFVPRSQATLRHGEDYTQLVKQTVKLKIKQCEGRHIVGSIREVLAGAADVAREKFWQDVEVGKQYAGIVKSLTSYGAFVDIGGVDGLVHISELSWNRIKHPSEVVNVGDTIDVYVKDIDSENKKVSLGYKKVEDNPWEKLKSEYPIGSTFTAPVVSITKFGAFVRILPGVDGLVHISEISHDRVEKVSDVLSVGQEVEVKLTDVDFDKKRISLSMKALLPETEASEDAAEAADTAPEAADAVETEESTEA
ncbi:MAG: bifunctional 4-hydroxy-3-methylbut-2-enyl diphosphate reductase/30S ribosomal protein S1 [Ruthenibacterium sp.]